MTCDPIVYRFAHNGDVVMLQMAAGDAGRDVISIPKGAKYPDDAVAFLGASVRVPGSRLFNDPGAASVFGGIMRFTKRIGLFDLAWCARNKCHLTAYVGEM